MYTKPPVGARLAREDGLTANLILQMYPKPCGSLLASDEGLKADQSIPVVPD
jgi:hypothetical protein